jgi:hypothetical protein
MLNVCKALLSIYVLSFVALLNAADSESKEMKTFLLKTIDDIPEYCTSLVQQLQEKPVFARDDFRVLNGLKFLRLTNWNDCMICEFLTTGADAMKKGDSKVWDIRSFKFSNACFYEGSQLDQGIQLQTYENRHECSLNELKQLYAKVIDNLKKGWEMATIYDTPKMRDKKPESGWICLIKTKDFLGEDILMRFLASRFGFLDFIHCSCSWLTTNESSSFEHTMQMYLWIEAKTFKDFQKIFRLDWE